MHLLSTPRRLPRPNEWARGKAVTFIVTLAATRSVTLAAREAGMSRKSAYARQGHELKEVEGAGVSFNQGDKTNRAAPSTSSSTGSPSVRRSELDPALRQDDSMALKREQLARERFFTMLANGRVESGDFRGRRRTREVARPSIDQ